MSTTTTTETDQTEQTERSQALPPMAAHTGYRLIKIGEQLMDLAESALAPLGIKPRHFNVLVTVVGHRELSQQELSRLIGIDVNAMVTVMDFLEHERLAIRERNPHDRRRHVVQVTERGLEVVRRGTELVAQAEAGYLAPLSAAEIGQLEALTGRLLGIGAAAG